ncbi:glycosyl transferase family 1 [Bryobacterales bacterium F-183]|nr:glycosyl transferase family 1 [Bryobacterales bacterium F-183]
MRIGVNALYLIPGGVGGTEIYLRSLLAALARVDSRNEYFVFTNRETGADLVPGSRFVQVPCEVNAVFRPGRILYEQVVLPARSPKVDVMFNPGFTAPVAHPHNVTVFHDLQHKRHPEYFRWFDLPFWNLLLWAAVKRSRKLISVSEATRDDLRRFYGAESTVVHHGADPVFFEIAEQRAPEDFFLCVSTLHPHKNIERLVRAFAAYGKSRLVLAGMKGFQTEAVERQIAALGLGDRVRVTGWIPREELLDLYRRAKGFIYPSTFEGFGMPVIEALAAEVPLACSDIEPMRSLAAGDAILFDPGSDDAVMAAFAALERAEARSNARIRREFTWDLAAERTLAVLNA